MNAATTQHSLISAHTYPSELSLSLGTFGATEEKLADVVSRADEVDNVVPLRTLRVNPDLSVRFRGEDVPAQAGFVRCLAKLVGYPANNFKSALTTDRVAGDINSLIQQSEKAAETKRDVLVRTQRGDLFGLWHVNGRAPHIPPKTPQLWQFIREQADWLRGRDLAEAVSITGTLMAGRLEVSMMMHGRDVTGLREDPSYAGLISSFDLRNRPGMQSGFHLMRIACTNSSVMHIGNGFSHAAEDLDLTLDRWRRSMEKAMAVMPLLPRVYRRMVDTRIETEEDFTRLTKPIRQLVGPMTGELLSKFTRLDDESGLRSFDPKTAKANERTNVYSLFNDLTFLAKESGLGTDIESRANRAAGRLFEGVFKPIRRDYAEEEAAQAA